MIQNQVRHTDEEGKMVKDLTGKAHRTHRNGANLPVAWPLGCYKRSNWGIGTH